MAGSAGSAVDPPVVELNGAVSLLGRFPALAGVDLTVRPGEVLMLQGPNGAGKSTLLRLCAGLAPLHDGEGSVLGFDLRGRTNRRSIRARIGLLGHATALYDELTVRQNIEFWTRGEADTASLDTVMDRLGVGGRLIDVPVGALSAGQRRRTSLAILVARRPQLWLLDEPHAGLDAQGRDLIDDLVRQAASQGATAIVASHELDRVEGLATRVANVIGGQVFDAA